MREQRERLGFEARAGKLVDAEEVRTMFVNLVVHTQNRLLAIPSKVKGQHRETSRQVLATMDAEIRCALEELADRGKAGL